MVVIVLVGECRRHANTRALPSTIIELARIGTWILVSEAEA